jgi:hypothetical protein
MLVEGCTFDITGGLGPTSCGIIVWVPADGVVVRDCYFFNYGLGITLVNSQNGLVSHCVIHSQRGGVDLQGFASASILDCDIYAEDGEGIIVRTASEGVISNCKVHGGYTALNVYTESQAQGEGNIFTGGQRLGATVWVACQSTLSLHGCHILRGESVPYALKLDWFQYDQLVQDLTGNYWGTTSPDSVAAWIWDGNDDPEIHSTVDYLPIANGPLPTEESKSWGEVKTLYR